MRFSTTSGTTKPLTFWYAAGHDGAVNPMILTTRPAATEGYVTGMCLHCHGERRDRQNASVCS
ncbi:MAG: hypothetical protein ACXWC3_19765, partial [Burkholderiales bacterium]